MTLTAYKTIYTLLFALSGVFFAVAVFCFFNFHIVDVIRDLYDLDIKLFASKKKHSDLRIDDETPTRTGNEPPTDDTETRMDDEPPTDDTESKYTVLGQKEKTSSVRLSTFGDLSEDDSTCYSVQNRRSKRETPSSEGGLSSFGDSSYSVDSHGSEFGRWEDSRSLDEEGLTGYEDCRSDDGTDFSEYETEPGDTVEMAKERIGFVSMRKTIICATDERIDY